MIKRVFAVPLLCVIALGIAPGMEVAGAANVYRTTDAQGNVVFTDKPVGNAERVDLEPLTVVPSAQLDAAPPRTQRAEPAASRDVGQPFMPYSTFRIAAPEDGQTLPTGAAGNVQVQLAIEPALREDHKVRLLVDGAISQSALHSSAFMLTNLERGEHTLIAELLDADGKVRHRSAPVTLYVQRASVNLPANPNNPAGLPPSRTGK
ncbi:DUF4124 domain-containing protein [Halomonas sp. HP20-15]|uniref:DUF4124 domain-containing protein n=1 Tax=Halomonas sp. HP20-15 TaxID=3085901 RepID=UPI0029810354|nr:DUF4124 domain-containing protein [Halomonas sp. HP20-15]MDW5378581.1 DUF4124 domain-containing protein [Halomonas sp. HP20-15]